ncbi:hypothetical protein EDM80_07465 [bacterium]|nr:MAG: hypothetical protein EDM80_07465 [bacterium]
MSAVVTGMGVVSALGSGVEAFKAALQQGVNACAMHEFERMGGTKAIAPAYRAVAPDAKGLIDPRKLRRMDRLIRMAAVSARQALNMAGLQPERGDVDASRLGVVFGTAYGAIGTTQEFIDSWLKNGQRHASPLAFMSSVHGILASQVALDIGATGANLTLSQRDVSFEAALASALGLLESGRADAILVGGADELTGLLHEFASHFRYVENGPSAGCDPWSGEGRAIPGDGGAVLLLEREGGPRRALARVEQARVSRHDTGREILDDLNRGGVDLATSCRAGSRRSAPLEHARSGVLAERLAVPELSYRGNFGNFPSAGALQAVVNVLMLQGQVFAPLAGGRQRQDLVTGIGPPRRILHDAASVTGLHGAYILSAV